MAKTSPFEFHTGISYESYGEQSVGQCPFCGKQDKFYFNKEFLWDCKNAECVDTKTGKRRSGNIYSFLKQLYEEFDTKTKAAQDLYQDKGIPKTASQRMGLKYNPYNDSYLIPTYKKGKINNLYKAVKQDGKYLILATPGISHTLFNFPDEPHETIWIFEGHWDRLVAETAFATVENVTLIGVPGAGVWNKEWTSVLGDRHVVFCYDNDAAGKTGFERVIMKMIAECPVKPKSIKYVDWPEDKPKGYDFRDMYLEYKSKTYNNITPWLKEFDTPSNVVVVKQTIETVKPNMEIDTFDKFLEVFSEQYYTTYEMEMLLLLCLCSIYSINIGGEQLWLRVIGPPGCGKTTVAKVLSASDQVVLKSTFTGLFSGWHDDSGEDASLIPTIAGKTLIVKDADALMQQPNVSRIFSELRDFYDKDSSTHYKNRVAHDYRNIPTTIILCGTNVLRRADQSFLGERFLDYEVTLSKEDERKIEERTTQRAVALALDPSTLPPETPVQAAAKGFISHLMDKKLETKLSPELIQTIQILARLTAKMRTKVDRDAFGRGDPTFSPVAEVGTRLIGQLVKMCMCVPVVTQKSVEMYQMDLLKKVVKDIIDPSSNRFRLCLDLLEGWYSRDELMESSGLSKNIVNRELDNLRLLHLVDEKIAPSVIPKYKRRVFTLKDEIKMAFEILHQ
ncbi:MAG: hypothetical protein KatS3mg087_1392 [Patescibacteria group bacterium]|nr:MAG: hypothetical protein KatS3mg087_1392 [Patescibacteria group bacterium]